MTTERARITRAENDTYYNEDGSSHIDMFSANGTALLGHGNPSVVAEVRQQLDRAWITGVLDSPARVSARQMVEEFFPSSHTLAGFYTTGMEAAEFAMRFARVTTGRKGFIGFARSMHGKSLATAYLAWDNPYISELPDFFRLPYPDSENEEEVLSLLRELLDKQQIAAVFIEPIQGSSGGRMASQHFCQEAHRLCQATGTLLLFDEILTGFYRTGTAFCHTNIGFMPDIVLIGKIMGNGFPVSGVIIDKHHDVTPAMLPGSTYAGNPLTASAVIGTLRAMRAMPIEDMVADIERKITSTFSGLQDAGFALRGKGALWILECPEASDAGDIAERTYKKGVLVIHAGPYLRLLPPATIEPDNLETACDMLAEAVQRQIGG